MVSLFYKMNSIYYCAKLLNKSNSSQIFQPPDRGVIEQYYNCKSYEKYLDKIKNITIINIVGGRKDVILEAKNLLIEEIVDRNHGQTFHMSYIPNIEITLDHHSIVSCSWWIGKFSDSLCELEGIKNYNSRDILETMKKNLKPLNIDKYSYMFALNYGYTIKEKLKLRITENFTFITLEYTHMLPLACNFILMLYFIVYLDHPSN